MSVMPSGSVIGVSLEGCELPEDLWAPLYERVNYGGYSVVSAFYFELENDYVYSRACQRWYGDNRVDHIRRV